MSKDPSSSSCSHDDMLKKLSPSAKYNIKWDQECSVLSGYMYHPSSISSKSPIAMIDFDGTLVRPKDGRKLPRQNDASDWVWAFPEVPEAIRKLSKKYRIVIISNQKRIQSCWSKKVSAVVLELGVLLTVHAATEDDNYRKPRTGMINRYIDKYGKLPKGSLFCGDAAGRPGDFADTDRKFALNADLEFYTPEELFQKYKPEKYSIAYPDISKIIKFKSFYLGNLLAGWSDSVPTMYIIVGLPGSGKSWYARYFFEARGCVRINADTMGSIAKCLKMADGKMRVLVDPNTDMRIFGGTDKQNLVIDNTNLDAATRAKWITLAVKYGYRVVCYDMQTDFDICRHNVVYRAITTGTKRIGDHVLRILRSKYKAPVKSEGFEAVIKIDFSPVGIHKDQFLNYCKYMF